MSNNEPSVPRLSARVFFNDVAGELFSLDRGVPYTLWQLLRQPGPTIRRYVELRDERLTKPFRLVLICLALAALVLSFTPLSQQFLKSAATTPTDPSDASNAFSAALTSVVAHFDVVLVLCWVPAMAAGVQAAYRRHALNYAEVFVFGLYTLPQMFAWMGVLLVLSLTLQLTSGWLVLFPLLWPVLASAHGYFRPEGEPAWRAFACMLFAAFSVVVLMLGVVMGLTLLGMFAP